MRPKPVALTLTPLFNQSQQSIQSLSQKAEMIDTHRRQVYDKSSLASFSAAAST